MAGKQSEWWSCKLKYLEANYERCKLKVRQDSLYCKMFILENQNRLEEEKRITLKYEKSAACQRLQQVEVSSVRFHIWFNLILFIVYIGRLLSNVPLLWFVELF